MVEFIILKPFKRVSTINSWWTVVTKYVAQYLVMAPKASGKKSSSGAKIAIIPIRDCVQLNI